MYNWFMKGQSRALRFIEQSKLKDWYNGASIVQHYIKLPLATPHPMYYLVLAVMFPIHFPVNASRKAINHGPVACVFAWGTRIEVLALAHPGTCLVIAIFSWLNQQMKDLPFLLSYYDAFQNK